MSLGWFAVVVGAFALGACGSGFTSASGDGAGDGADGSSSGLDGSTTGDGAAATLDGSGATGDATVGDGGTGGDDDGTIDSGERADGASDGGPCINDCQGAEYIALTGPTIDFLSLNGSYTVWIEGGTMLRYAPYGSSSYQDAGTTLVSIPAATGLATNSSEAYVSSSGGTGNFDLFGVTLGGSPSAMPVVAMANNNNPVSAVTFAGTLLYDITNGHLETHAANLVAAGVDTGTMASQVQSAGSDVYFVQGSSFFACNGNCMAPVVLFSVPVTEAFAFAVNANKNVFWYDQASGSILGCTFDPSQSALNNTGCAAPQTIATVAGFGGIATAGDYVYWIDTAIDPAGVYSAHAAQTNGALAAPFAQRRMMSGGDDSFANLAVSSKYVVWSQLADDHSGRAIMRVDAL